MKNLSREQLIDTYLIAQKVGLADIFIQLIEQEMKSRQVTLDEVNIYCINQKKFYMN